MEKYIKNLEENSAISLSRELNEIRLNEKDTCVIRFGDNISCSPFGMLLAESSIKEFRKNNPNVPFHAKFNEDDDSIKYAGHMGFFKSISENINFGKSPGEASGNNNYIPITKIDFSEYRKIYTMSRMDPVRYIEFESRKLAKVLAQNNKELEELFTFLIREIVRNSMEHGATGCAWVCGQNWRSRNVAEIAILDEGIGYKQSLQKKYGERIKNDESAVRFALKPGVTESFSRKFDLEEENSGFGLYVSSEICSALNGSFSVLSGDTLLRKNNGAVSIMNGFHKGAIVKMSVNTSTSFKYTPLLSEIVANGQKEICDSKKASELSRGKFLLT